MEYENFNFLIFFVNLRGEVLEVVRSANFGFICQNLENNNTKMYPAQIYDSLLITISKFTKIVLENTFASNFNFHPKGANE